MANPVQPIVDPVLPAPTTQGSINFKLVLQEMVRRNGSDLHLKVGRPPTVRVDGELEALDHTPLSDLRI
jgi:twitching motility protein PilT